MKTKKATLYVEFNSEFIDGPLYSGLTAGAQLLWIRIATYSCRNNTCGLIHKSEAHKIVRAGCKHALELITERLVTDVGDSYRLNHQGKFWRRGSK